jgi:long-chain acyl-CoA synthetase
MNSVQELLVAVSEEHSARPAIVTSEGHPLTYRDLATSIARLALQLEHRGVQPGDRVGLLLPNGPGFVKAYFAILCAGAIAVPMNEQYQTNELLYFLEVCDVGVLVTTRAHEDLCRQVLALRDRPVGLEFIEDLAASPATSSKPLRDVIKAPAAGAPAMYQFSSGSTGRPKQIGRSHSSLLFELDSLRRTLRITPDDRFLGVAPFSHVNGLMRSMMASITSGAALYPLPRFERQAVADCIRENRLTIFIGVPFHFSTLAKARFRPEADFSSLRLCVSASAPMPTAMNRLFHEQFGHYVRQLYGSTETGTISVNLEDNIADSIDTVGKPIYGVAVEVFLEDGDPAPPGEMGEFAVESPGAIRAYVNAEEANRESFRGGYFFTGDLGRRDASGVLTIAGRKKFFINKAGYKIDPKEIQDLLESHPKVEEAVVLGLPTSYGDEKVTAVVVGNGACTAEELVEFCRGKIAPFKIPSVIEFRASIPKSPTGKIRRAMLYPQQT